MSAARPRSEAPFSVGIICADRSLSRRIEGVIEEAFGIGFALSPTEFEKKRAALAADAVVVASPLVMDDTSILAQVRSAFPDEPIVACTPEEEAGSIRSAVQSGVDGIVWESRLEETLLITIHAVVAGQLVVPQDSRSRMQPPDLTNREKQSLSLVLMGLTNREIADKLFISESTVKSHLHSAYGKLGVHSRTEAVRRIADPVEGLGTGILAITGPGLARGAERVDPRGQRSSTRKGPE